MSRQVIVKWYLIILSVCGLFFIAGCPLFSGYGDLGAVQIAPEKLQTIEPLELKKAKVETEEPSEVKETPPSEIELTLEQYRAMALENNLELKAQLINPAIAAERVSEEEAKFEASFFTNVFYDKVNSPSVGLYDQIAGSRMDMRRADVGVEMPLRTGGTLTFDVVDTRTETDAEGTLFNPYYGSTASLSISQPLLRNAGRRASMYSIYLARSEQQITDARTKLEVIRVIAAMDRVYWRFYAARRELEVRQQQYELAQAQLEQAKRFVELGERAPVEVLRAEAGVARQLEAIIVAENNLRDRQRELKHVINMAGVDMQSATVLVPLTQPDPVRYELGKKQLVTAAVDNRQEMLELELQLAQDIANIDYLRNQALPLVTLDYTYNVSGLGASRQDSYDLLWDSTFEGHRFGLQLLVPLGNQGADSRLQQAFYQRMQRLANKDNQKALIELEVLNAIDQVEANWQRILASRQTAILNGRLYEAEKRQFELGLVTSTDVLEAQASFADAQSAEIQALAEYQISLVDLAYATGTLLGSAKVRWEPIVPETE